MRRQIDLLFGGILTAVFLGTIAFAGGTPLGGTSVPSTFPASLQLNHVDTPLDPPPDAFKAMGRMGRVLVGQHTVQPRETLTSLAKLYGSTATSLRSTNRLESPSLAPGKTLLVHTGEGMLHQLRETKGLPEPLQKVADRYGQSTATIARANRLPGVALLSGTWLQPGDVLFIPNARLRFADFDLPVAWARGRRLISSGFGMRRHPIYRYRSFHKGWDMPRPYGFAVKASREGRVIFSGWRGGYGRLIIVRHEGGLRTWYGHLSSADVKEGARVTKGQVIGRVGNSGISTGPHLHFEVRDRYGNSINPKKFLF